MVKNLPTMEETRIRSLGQEDPLEKETAIRSSILAWEIPWTEEPGGLQSIGLQKSWTSSRLKTTTDKTRESALGFDIISFLILCIISEF